MDALQESSANVESWKKQLSACKEESDTLREKVIQSCAPAGNLNNVHKPLILQIKNGDLSKETLLHHKQTVKKIKVT